MEISKNISLSPYTTFRIGGPAKFFVVAKNAEDFIEAQDFARKKGVESFVLGGGSNILVDDAGFDGLVIKNEIDFLDLEKSIGSSVSISQLSSLAIKNGLAGLEWAAGLPGTVGGAIRGNAGCFGKDISSIVDSVDVVVGDRVSTLKTDKCGFSYRDSVFKKDGSFIASARFRLNKAENIEEVEGFANDCLRTRKEKHAVEPSAGCVFKNPKPLIVGELVRECGLLGRKHGGAQIFLKHGNFIINVGGAKSSDVSYLINLIKENVLRRFKIELKEEIQYVG